MLAIDIGNTQTDFAIFEAGQMVWRDHVATTGSRSGETGRIRDALAPRLSPSTPIFVASVVPGSNSGVPGYLPESAPAPVFLDPQQQTLLPLGRVNAAQTGVDRLLAARAGWEQSGRAPTAIIQVGTACTVDWVDAGGTFQGGAILPGPRLWLEALSKAARLPDLSAEDLSRTDGTVPGTDTASAITAGLLTGLPGALLALRDAWSRKAGTPLITLITGGGARDLLPRFSEPLTHAPDLVLHGIRLVADALLP